MLVNNATAARNADLWQLTEAEWDLAIDVNLKGYFALIREVAPHFCGQGAGAIVNTSSGSGFGHPSAVAYAAAKEGVVGLTRTVARELGRFGVRCNAIRPLALGRSTAEYSEATAKWSVLMAETMRPRGGAGVAVRGGHPRHPSAGEDLTDRRLALHRCRTDVNGRTFHVTGDLVARFADSQYERQVVHEGGWTLDALDEIAPTQLVDDLSNDFLLEDHPELQRFEG